MSGCSKRRDTMCMPARGEQPEEFEIKAHDEADTQITELVDLRDPSRRSRTQPSRSVDVAA